MPITNLNNKHLSTDKIKQAQTAIEQLALAVKEIDINLTANERQKYGSINEKNKLIVHKVYDYFQNQPQLSSPEVNWIEFAKDYTSRQNLEALISQLENITTQLRNAKILHDFDNYQAALTDYAYTTYKASTSVSGYETKRNEISQFFAKKKGGSTSISPDTM